MTRRELLKVLHHPAVQSALVNTVDTAIEEGKAFYCGHQDCKERADFIVGFIRSHEGFAVEDLKRKHPAEVYIIYGKKEA